MAFYFEKTKKVIIMTEENEEDFKNINICRFCEKEISIDKVRGQCHLTGKYRGPILMIFFKIRADVIAKPEVGFPERHFLLTVACRCFSSDKFSAVRSAWKT